MSNTDIPAVLVLSGLDPSGGAGIQADIEALASHGCHTCPVVTTLTTQDTTDIKSISAVSVNQIVSQIYTILEDIQISAIKIGLLANIPLIYELRKFIDYVPDIPVILDPILASGGGTSIADSQYVVALVNELLPVTNILTPNHLEALTLANISNQPVNDIYTCGRTLTSYDCDYVLITGGHIESNEVTNTLFQHLHPEESFSWQRLPGQFHGSGCTLSASIAGLLAQGRSPLSAIQKAQDYTWGSLKHAYQIGKGQLIPNRFFWAEESPPK